MEGKIVPLFKLLSGYNNMMLRCSGITDIARDYIESKRAVSLKPNEHTIVRLTAAPCPAQIFGRKPFISETSSAHAGSRELLEGLHRLLGRN